jgi:hypothetical protein
VKYVAVSWTIRPVTQIAEVEVKRASIRDIWPDFVLKGRRRSTAPAKIAIKKLMARTWAGENLISDFFICLLPFNSFPA